MYLLTDVYTQRLHHVFRYIKELLLLQNHNLRMYIDHQTLTTNNINVYSVTADAFTVDANKLELKLELVKSLLNFDNGIGAWRLLQVEYIYIYIYYPTQDFVLNHES